MMTDHADKLARLQLELDNIDGLLDDVGDIEIRQQVIDARPDEGVIVAFSRHVMGQTFNYAAIYAAGVWYVTGSLKSRRTFRQDEFVGILAEDETSDIAVAETWTQLIV